MGDPRSAELLLLDQELSAIVATPDHELASLAVLAIDDGVVSYEGHFGRAHIDDATPNNSVPVGSGTIFRMASISKLVTTIGLMRLVDQGRVELDADVSDALGFSFRNPNFPDDVITLRMLLSHRSSLTDDGDYPFPSTTSLQEVLSPTGAEYDGAAWATPDPATSRAPGDYFRYANLNFGIVATVIEAVTQVRFDQYMTDSVFAPLGIEGGFREPAAFSDDVLARVATLYRKRDADDVWDSAGPWVPQADDYVTAPPVPRADLGSYVLGTNGTLFGPQGSLRISVADLGKIMRLLMNQGTLDGVQILLPQTVAAMQAEEWRYDEAALNGDDHFGLFLSWGLGMQRFTDQDLGDRLITEGGFGGVGHLGDAFGLLAGFTFDPATGDGLIYVIGGLGADPDTHLGEYSILYRWEEQILSALHRRAIEHDAKP